MTQHKETHMSNVVPITDRTRALRQIMEAFPEVAALVDASVERDGGVHDKDCRIWHAWRDTRSCNCGHDAFRAALAPFLDAFAKDDGCAPATKSEQAEDEAK